MEKVDFLIIGAGAAGVFAAICIKQRNPNFRVVVLEKTNSPLAKVRVSGGGRCNVTHNCFNPRELVKNYPRGAKELLGPFYTFNPTHMIEWLKNKGVELHIENDNRMFPVTNSSQTIIDCLLSEAKKLDVELILKCDVVAVLKENDFLVTTKKDDQYLAKSLLLATGSNKLGHNIALHLGHTIDPLLPSLFTFNTPSSPLLSLSGISLPDVELKVEKKSQRGPLLLTHFGFSGPCAIKLSAWVAPQLFAKEYQSTLFVNWLPNLSEDEIAKELFQAKAANKEKQISTLNPFSLPKKLWLKFIDALPQIMRDISDRDLRKLSAKLHSDSYKIEGKTTNKEEFVTCGGVNLKEVNFKTMESKIVNKLYFAGEILNIDGITGGFNFQNAWTTAYLTALQSD
ncbi:MAG: NAD(P)/FAD-dependent oxidoreductase [Rhabdochlamydiaceae bacterium]|nr:NAD(P)/FAD-dependent oxidoreductase [Candidatus Amphrikana amoebophyrae]